MTCMRRLFRVGLMSMMTTILVACDVMPVPAPAESPEPPPTARSAAWPMLEHPTCCYSLRYPPSWHVHQFEITRGSAEYHYCAILSTAPGNVSWQDATEDERARVVISRQARQSNQYLLQWVSAGWPFIAQIPEPFSVGGMEGMQASVEPETLDTDLRSIFVWLQTPEYFYAISGHIRPDIEAGSYDEMIDEIISSFQVIEG